MSNETVLEESERIVQGARQKEYGHPLDNWEATAARWSITLRKKLREPITAEEAVLCMLDVKIDRLSNGIGRDSLVDVGGYARCIEMIGDERERRAQSEPATPSGHCYPPDVYGSHRGF